MADKKLNEVTKVTDMAYVPVIMSDGSIGQIAKSDLASVMAGVMDTNKLFPFMVKGNISITSFDDIESSEALNTCTGSGMYRILTAAKWGTLIVFKTNLGNGGVVQQLYNGSLFKVRVMNSNERTWGPWQCIDNFGYNSLAELAGGVAEQIGTGTVILKTLQAGESYTIKESGYAIYAIINRSQVGYGALFCIGYSSVSILSDPKAVIGESKISITKSGSGADTVVTNNYDSVSNLRIRKLV